MAVRHPYPKTVICDRSLNHQTSGYTYAQTPYIEILAFPHFLRSIHFFRVAMLQTPNFFVISVTDVINFWELILSPQFGSMNRFVDIYLFSNNSGSFYISETFK